MGGSGDGRMGSSTSEARRRRIIELLCLCSELQTQKVPSRRSSDILMTYIFLLKGPFADSTVGTKPSSFRDAAGSDQKRCNSVETTNKRGWTTLQSSLATHTKC